MKEIISTDDAPQAIGPYSQAININDFLFVSGQIPINPTTGEISDTIEEQTHQVMKNLEAILNKTEMKWENVVKTSIFLKDMNDFSVVNDIYASYFSSNFPARETMQVAKLPKDVRVEISLIASK